MNELQYETTPAERGFTYFLLRPWGLGAIALKNRALLIQITKRSIRAQHKGSLFGFAWMLINPLLMMGIYTFVFGFIFGATYDEAPEGASSKWTYGLGLFLSLTFFQFFAEVLSSSPAVILSQPNLTKKVVFPLELLPLSSIGTALFRFICGLAIVILAICIVNRTISPNILKLGVLMIPLVLMSLGVSLAFASLGVFIRDIMSLTQFLSLAIMYGSAVFYSISDVKSADVPIWQFLRFNPLMHLIDQSRQVALWGKPIDWNTMGYAYLASFLIFIIGYALFARLKSAFADVM